MRALIQASQVVNEKRRGFTPRGEESQIGGDKDSTAEGWTEVKKDIVVGGQTPLTCIHPRVDLNLSFFIIIIVV